MNLKIEKGVCGYKNTVIIDSINIGFEQGEIVGILGPNGVGKTTMFKSILGLLPLIGGEISLDGVNKNDISVKEFSKNVGYVPQSNNPPFPFTVPDVVVMGRVSRLKRFERPGIKDYLIAYKALDTLSVSYLRNKVFTEISGGERQMVLIARALAQSPKLLVMDEPTANLDLGNQIRVLSTIKKLSKMGLGVLMTTHSPDHAFLCCDRIILLTKNKEVMIGNVDEIVTEENLKRAYGIDVKITEVRNSDGKIIKTCVPII